MPKLIRICGCDNPVRLGDVIFIHGLGGDGLETWHHDKAEIDAAQKSGSPLEPRQLDFWPTWLGQDRQDLGIWSLDYELEPSDWKGGTMPLAERAKNVLELFANKRIGQRPIIFITHSMGGLLAKQLLRTANDTGTERQKRISAQTKGIVFLATPHSGANLANWAKFINDLLLKLPKLSVSVDELEYGHSRLQELNEIFRGHPRLGQIPVKAYYETQPLKLFGVVVDKVCADLGKPEPVIPVDANHINICKISPAKKEEGVVYDSVLLFLEDCLPIDDRATSSSNTDDALPHRATTAPNPSGNTVSDGINRGELYQQLVSIPAPTLGQIIFILNPRRGVVPGSMTAQGLRVEALLAWAEEPGGCGLAAVKAVLDEVIRPR